MGWFIRMGCVGLLLFFCMACELTGDVGNPCKLTQEENRKNLEQLDRKARIVEASASCDVLSFCFANYFDAQKVNEGLGYCSKDCDPNDTSSCPTGFTCGVFVSAQPPPELATVLAPIVNKAVCIKNPPEAAQP